MTTIMLLILILAYSPILVLLAAAVLPTDDLDPD